MKHKKKFSFGYFLMCTFLTLLCITMIYPLIYTLSLSFSDAASSMMRGLHLYPKTFSLASYKMVLAEKEIYIGYANTIYRTVLGTTLSVLVTAMAAYAMSRPSLPHSKLIGFIFLFTMLFSGGQVPMYLLINNLNLMDNRLVYILPTMVSAYNILIVKAFMKNDIPDALPEAAKIDGASELSIFFRIILPLSKPILATIALWSAVAHWNTWLDSMLYMSDRSKQVLAIFMQNLIKENQTGMITANVADTDRLEYTSKTIQAATIIVTIFPILAIYPFLQKYFVKGIMIGSVKG